LQIKEAMANLFENGQTDLQGKVINAGYNFVLILVQILGVNYVFSVETYPQSDSQETKPPQQTPVAEEDIPYLSNPPTKKEAQAYWTSSIEKNADGTRKGGILGDKNLGVNNIFIEDVLHFRVEKNTNKNTVLQINTIEHSNGGLSACCMNVYACQTPSPQAVVDTPNFVSVFDVLYVFVIARGLVSKSQGKVDYPSTESTQSIALGGGGFVGGNQTVQQAHDAEVEEEGAKAKSAQIMHTFNLPQRTDGSEEPRYCKFSFETSDGQKKTFGMNRGRTNNIQVRYFGTMDEVPTMYKPTDKKEVMDGFWIPAEEFLGISNDPNTRQSKYVPWIAHQAIVLEAVDEILKL
jgi:hypothetical protein